MQRGERAELLGDHQRRVVGQHDAAGPNADRLRAGRDMGHDHGGGGTGDAGHVVMFGEPVAAVAPILGVAREVERVGKGGGDVAAFGDGGEVEDG